MTYFNILWIAYWIGLLLLVAIAWVIRLCGHRGKWFRAFLIAAASGLIVFWLTHLIYLLIVKVPVAPSPRSHEEGDLLVMLYNLYSFLFEGLAPSVEYKLGLYFDPVLYGGLSIPVAFIASFFVVYPESARKTEMLTPSLERPSRGKEADDRMG